MCVCQWPNVPSLASTIQLECKIQQKCFVCMRSSSLDLTGEKHFSIRDPSFQVNAQWPMPSWGCGVGWVMCSACTTPPHPPHPPIHPPNSPKNQNFEKMKKYLETSSFYKSVPKTMIIHYTVPEILHMWQMLLLFFILACFLPFYSPPNSPKKQFFFKKEKNTWGYHHFTHVHRKWWSDDVWFLRYGAWRTDRWKDRESDGKSDI